MSNLKLHEKRADELEEILKDILKDEQKVKVIKIIGILLSKRLEEIKDAVYSLKKTKENK
jgi:hypothetical protein